MAQASSLAINPTKLKQLKLRIEKDTFLFPGMKKLKLSGKDLQVLPKEIFLIEELDVLDLSPEREACMEFRLLRIPPGRRENDQFESPYRRFERNKECSRRIDKL